MYIIERWFAASTHCQPNRWVYRRRRVTSVIHVVRSRLWTSTGSVILSVVQDPDSAISMSCHVVCWRQTKLSRPPIYISVQASSFFELFSTVSGACYWSTMSPETSDRHSITQLVEDVTLLNSSPASEASNAALDAQQTSAMIITQMEEKSQVIVDFEGDDDPANPINWSRKYKWTVIFLMSIINLIAYAVLACF